MVIADIGIWNLTVQFSMGEKMKIILKYQKIPIDK